MRLLIAGSKIKFILLKEFGDALEKLGVEYKLVYDTEIYDTFPSQNIRNWFGTRTKFKKLISEYKPDAVFVDRTSHFALAVRDEKIPLFMLLRGDFWSEVKWLGETLYKNPVGRIILWQWKKMNEKCFTNATLILPICKYLEKIVKERYPKNATEVLYGGIDVERWNLNDDTMNLKHPCVGLLQDANIWGKTKEILTFEKVIQAMPDVTFYWAGDGPYREKILSSLKKYENFKWLGSLKSQDVRRYLTSMDVYALPSGIDMIPSTLLEAQLMQRPVVATNVGGIPETMQENKTGFLVEKGDHAGWIEKLRLLLNDKEKAKQMGLEGRNFAKANFDWSTIAKQFLGILDSYMKINTMS